MVPNPESTAGVGLDVHRSRKLLESSSPWTLAVFGSETGDTGGGHDEGSQGTDRANVLWWVTLDEVKSRREV